MSKKKQDKEMQAKADAKGVITEKPDKGRLKEIFVEKNPPPVVPAGTYPQADIEAENAKLVKEIYEQAEGAGDKLKNPPEDDSPQELVLEEPLAIEKLVGENKEVKSAGRAPEISQDEPVLALAEKQADEPGEAGKGTYPPADVVPVDKEIEPPQKTKRVGSFTLALTLIATGVLMIAAVIVPSLDYVTIARLLPVVLVIFGLEILWANIRHKDKKIKYDALSVIIGFLLITGSVFIAVWPQEILFNNNRNIAASRIASEYEKRAFEALKNENVEIESLYANIPVYTDFAEGPIENMTLDTMPQSSYVQVSVSFATKYETKEDFVKAAKQVLQKLQTTLPEPTYITFGLGDNTKEGQTDFINYYLRLEGKFQMNASESTMLGYVQQDYYAPNGARYENKENYEKEIEILKKEEQQDAESERQDELRQQQEEEDESRNQEAEQRAAA